MKKLLLVFSILILASCSRNENLKVITLHDLSKKADCITIPLDSIVSSTEVIELDNSEKAPIIGVISDLYESYQSYYIVSDEKNVYEYEKTGKFVRQIGTQGRGPGEFLFVKKIFVNEKDSSVNLFDFPSQKLLKYDREGNFLSSFKPDFKDTLLYLKSFFPYRDSLLFYTSNNSSGMDLFLYNYSLDNPVLLSKIDREMQPGELIIGNVFIFGDRQNPYIYNYFNDTLFRLRNKKLNPEFLIQTNKMTLNFEELSMENMQALEGNKLYMRNIVQGGDFIFFFYQVNNAQEKVRNSFLSLYNIESGSYNQNVKIKDKKDSLLTLGSRDLVFQGSSTKDILVIKGQTESDKNPLIIKFRMK
ncbi:MAG: hypothetical protein A2X18_14515 [Bacteroidetes bacterium GWF2_40_14]|nr:MAG: hypothetical protein A2X18_14515 [Bacteroidetes bacterium GWF2_40_14]